ncbi:Hypothetical predicted protein [Octopus vulgaris]|uniref:Uncharacterized protein n=1 Tax=Octopus vulgaris TaxID=6645 RepID=A0AA36B312_OCTVU|nr:Hypothetical predicted protein [Octopus vulgaris]
MKRLSVVSDGEKTNGVADGNICEGNVGHVTENGLYERTYKSSKDSDAVATTTIATADATVAALAVVQRMMPFAIIDLVELPMPCQT